MKTPTEVLEQLRRVDKQRATAQDVLNIFKAVAGFGLYGMELSPHSRVLRCRTHAPDFPKWRKESEISYFRNDQLGRATLPGDLAFYGCLASKEGEFEESRLLSIHETNRLMWDSSFNHEEEYAIVGCWTTLKPLHVVAIVQADRLHTKNPWLRSQYEAYLGGLDASHTDKEGSRNLLSLIADEFIAEVDRSAPHEYLISAAFAHCMIERGLDGVAYPSARAQGDTNAFNVALTPTAIDDHCTLGAVYAYRLIKEQVNSLIPMPFLADRHVNGYFKWEDPGFLPRPDFIKEQLRRQRLLPEADQQRFRLNKPNT